MPSIGSIRRHPAESTDPSPVLIIGLAGRMGSGVSFVRDKLLQGLMTYGYRPDVVQVSRLFLQDKWAEYSGEILASNPPLAIQPTGADVQLMSAPDRVEELQKRGDCFRYAFGADVLAKLVLRTMFEDLRQTDTSPRIAYLVDSLKHPLEAAYFRSVLRGNFVMIGVVACDKKRESRLRERKEFGRDRFLQLSVSDARENLECGQHSVETILGSDYFIRNEYSRKDDLFPEVDRFLRLLFRAGLETPRHDEIGMNLAFKAACGSACLSRQVGAAILGKDNDVLALGRNDVPCYGGGLYTSDSPEDFRCWTYGSKCYNDFHKEQLLAEIATTVVAALPSPTDEARTQVAEALAETRIRQLIEFSRSIHAEMDAVLSVARSGRPGLVGSTLYCTTYPCHNCAKHIVGAGIRRLVYLEPYEKSLALELHGDSLEHPSTDNSDHKLLLDTYEGVAPSQYERMFEAIAERKTKATGAYVDNDSCRTTLHPVSAQVHVELWQRIQSAVADLARGTGEAREEP